MSDEQRLKISAAQAFEAVLRQMGARIVLGGGGGATALGGPRAIKDLDYKMREPLRTQWQALDDVTRRALVDDIKRGMERFGYIIESDNADSKRQLKYVLRLKVKDKLSGKMRVYNARHKVTGRQSVEISLTSTGTYPQPWRAWPRPGQRVHVLDPVSMILDKVFVLAQRAPTDLHKIHTDFVDLNALLQRFESRVSKELAEMRQELCDELDMRLQGFGKSARIAQVHRFDFMLEVLQRVQWIRPLLLRQPQPGESRDPHLRFMEVKFMIQRLDRLLWALEGALSGVR